jgi:predicted DNA repair protein MutK
VAAVGRVLGFNGVSGSWGSVIVLVVDMVCDVFGGIGVGRSILVGGNKVLHGRVRLSLTCLVEGALALAGMGSAGADLSLLAETRLCVGA